MTHDPKPIQELLSHTIAIVGLPLDENSSFMRGPALAPGKIRRVVTTDETNACAESGHNLEGHPLIRDLGDIELGTGIAALGEIEEVIGAVLQRGAFALSLGGDHSVTYPILRAYARKFPRLNLLHFDAHPDLDEHVAGNRYSHAAPFTRIMEEQLAVRLVQIGIRTANPFQRGQARRFGVEVIDMRAFRPDLRLDFDGPVYLTLDLDALDPAYAPGVSHREPGGLSPREIIRLIQNIDVPLVGADIVELNPERDPSGATAVVAAKFLKEIAAQMLTTNGIEKTPPE